MRWSEMMASCVEGYSGTNPMSDRADVLVAAARLVITVRYTALQTEPAIATVCHNQRSISQATIPTSIDSVA